MKDTSCCTPPTMAKPGDVPVGRTTIDPIESENNAGKEFLRGMLNKLMKIKLSDGRILIGVFLCTDRDSNVILGSCSEYVVDQGNNDEQPPVVEPAAPLPLLYIRYKV